jgi:hypothetical protein
MAGPPQQSASATFVPGERALAIAHFLAGAEKGRSGFLITSG